MKLYLLKSSNGNAIKRLTMRQGGREGEREVGEEDEEGDGVGEGIEEGIEDLILQSACKLRAREIIRYVV